MNNIKSYIYDNIRGSENFVYDMTEIRATIKNWHAVLFASKTNTSAILKLRRGGELNVRYAPGDTQTLFKFIKLLHKAIKVNRISAEEVAISIDGTNIIRFKLDLGRREDSNLVYLVYEGYIQGGDFKDGKHMHDRSVRDSTIIIHDGSPRIVETSEGIKFYLEYTNPGILLETYVLRIHETAGNYKGKVVIDVGANMGDTPLLFASKGAKVYAFEPIGENFNAMVKNIELNKGLRLNITPIHAAIGEDGEKTFYYNSNLGHFDGGASAYLDDSLRATKEVVKTYTLPRALKKFKLKKAELLKMDAKGAEFLLRPADIRLFDKLKIEYSTFGGHTLEHLLMVVQKAGFDYCIFNHGSWDPIMTNNLWLRHGTIFAVKKT